MLELFGESKFVWMVPTQEDPPLQPFCGHHESGEMQMGHIFGEELTRCS